MDRKGPFSFAIVRLGEGWPMGNLHVDGCKHDVLMADGDLVEVGIPRPCCKCGALLIPWPVFRAAASAFMDAWEGDTEVLDQRLPTDAEIAERVNHSEQAEALWAMAAKVRAALDPARANTELDRVLTDAVRGLLREGRG